MGASRHLGTFCGYAASSFAVPSLRRISRLSDGWVLSGTSCASWGASRTGIGRYFSNLRPRLSRSATANPAITGTLPWRLGVVDRNHAGEPRLMRTVIGSPCDPVLSTAFWSGNTFLASVWVAVMRWSTVGYHQPFLRELGSGPPVMRPPHATLHRKPIGSASRMIRSIVAARRATLSPAARHPAQALRAPTFACYSYRTSGPIRADKMLAGKMPVLSIWLIITVYKAFNRSTFATAP